MSYASLAVPWRTKCPPFLKANSVCPNRVWFDPERALTADAFRKQYPLHYHLSRYDAAAVWATVKAGADPGKRDTAGRTVLDLAVETSRLDCSSHAAPFGVGTGEGYGYAEGSGYSVDVTTRSACVVFIQHGRIGMALELLEVCFCTSTAVDNVDTCPTTLLSSSSASPPKGPNEVVVTNPFVAKYKDACSNLYDHLDRMRFETRSKAHSSARQRQMPFLYRSSEDPEGLFKRRFIPVLRAQNNRERDSYTDEGRDVSSFPLPEEDITSFYSLSRRERPQQFLYAFNEKGRPSALQQLERDQARLEQRQLQQSLLVVVNDFLQRPPNKAAVAQMRELIRRLNLLLSVVQKFSTMLPLRREAARKAGDQLGRYITYPYMYIATMYQLFKGYPKALGGEVWDALNPADSRRLVLTVQTLRLRGHELLSFLGTVCRLFDNLLSTLHVADTGGGFNGKDGCLGRECCQYYLHMAFTLDDLGLFQKFIFSSGLFKRRDIFKWEDLLYTLMEYRGQFRDYLAPLLVKRLKARVQRRFVSDADKKAEYMEESVKYPYEERYLTRRLLEEYGDIFGPQEAEELSTMLRHWRYGAARPVPSREADWHARAPWLFKPAR